MNWDVISVKPLKPLELSVLFKDGTEGKVRFEPGHLRGVFEALKAPEFFRQARVEEGAVTWPGEHGPAKSILPRCNVPRDQALRRMGIAVERTAASTGSSSRLRKGKTIQWTEKPRCSW